MTDAAQVALIISSGSVLVAIIQKYGHVKHEQVSTANHNLSMATNEAVNRLEIAVDGDLDKRIRSIIQAELSQQE